MSQIPVLKKQLRLLAIIAALLIGVQIVNLVTGNLLNQFGLVPRSLSHIGYLFTAPFLHGNIAHLLTNLLPLLLFMWLTMQWGNRVFVLTTLTIMILAGLAVWLFGRQAYHIGASGMVYGYFGFLVLAGFVSKKIPYLIISVLVALLYGSMLVGVLPTQGFISFEYHLFGFVSGLIAAWAWAR